MKILTLILLVSSFHLFAQKPQKYVVGVESVPFLPYSIYEEGKYNGIFREILDLFATQHNIIFEYKALPVSRLYSEFFSNKIDFKMPDNKMWKADLKKQRGFNIIYSAKVVEYVDGILSSKEKLAIENLKTLGIITGFTPWGYEENIERGNIILRENSSLSGLLQQAILGRVDGIYTNVQVANYYLNKDFKQKKIFYQEGLPFIKGSYHLSTIKHPELIEKFNKFLVSKKTQINNIIESSLNIK